MSIVEALHSSRRDFLNGVVSAGAFVLGAQVLSSSKAEAAGAAWNPSVYLGLESDGSVIIVAHRSEMGTGIRSVLPMVVADELEADWKRVRVEQALGDTKYGSQNTDGSCSIRDFYDAMRIAGSSAKLMLEKAAADKWKVAAGECKAQSHFVVHSSGKKLGFGELVADASKLPVPDQKTLKFKAEGDYKYIGKSLPMVDRTELTTGKGVYGIDAKMPGMLYAVIERPPVLGGKVLKVDDSEARKVAGVSDTATLDPFKGAPLFQQLGGVAVLANSTWAAMQGRKKLKVEWQDNANAAYESDGFKKQLQDKARQPQKVVRNLGNVDAEFGKDGAKIHEAEYYVPMLSHAPMEPPAAVAEFKDGKVVTWCATQNPQAVQDAVAGAMGIDKKNVECHVTLLGGGFGRKSKPDYVVEAALLSRKTGKPVKVIWTREDDIRFDYYHTVAAMYMKAATDSKGKPTAWLQRSVFPTIGSTFAPGAEYGQEFEMGMGWTDLPFGIPHHRAENGPAKSHVRIGWMRAVANIYHAFAIHSFADELAAAAGRDRIGYLLDLLGPERKLDFAEIGGKVWNNGQTLDKYPYDTGRMRRVLELAAEKSNWANKKPGNGRALGVAVHRSFVSNVAAVVEVEVGKDGKLFIPRVDIAVDSGTIIHPDRVKAQMEGAAVFGVSVAMGEITAKDGRIQQRNFNDYPVARMTDAPFETHVHIVPSKEPPAGVGEPGVPPIAPAICNAIFAATGKRIRELPLKRAKLA
jgi:isoquinoline 1-oxidoreductase beta subunit